MQTKITGSKDTNAANVVKCTGQEDPTCSDSIPSTGINDAHLRYFGQGEYYNRASWLSPFH